MPAFSRRNITKALSIIGLRKTFVALRDGNKYSINRLSTPNGDIKLDKVGDIVDPNPLTIGRVGMPDPNLGIRWRNSMTFYGSWFDDLALSDTDYRIRNSILGLSREKLIEQISRDNRYGVIGTYYAVFLEILALNKGVPIVVLDDSLLGLGSFPVIIPQIVEPSLEGTLSSVLAVLLKREAAAASDEVVPDVQITQTSAADAAKYFPA